MSATSPSPSQSGSLSDHDVALLECERELWGPAPGKTDVVRERFGLGLAAYYLRLAKVCETEAALAYDALLVRRIREGAERAVSTRLHLPSGGRRYG